MSPEKEMMKKLRGHVEDQRDFANHRLWAQEEIQDWEGEKVTE